MKPVVPNQEAVTSKDEKAKTTYHQYFDKRHGVKSLPDLQPGDVVSVKLDQQKGWKTPALGKSLQEAILLGHMSSRLHLA